uniref:Major facilitator superfamily (MFS) profile domain-containing protein n=1 Tax=Timema douglasi TaxID=61478 RepID=A0A7R8VS41_TIMDO|nr:unnamed protein product [Timema douglasi]
MSCRSTAFNSSTLYLCLETKYSIPTCHQHQCSLLFELYAMMWFFMTGYLPVGFELAAELTYPEPEGTSAGILNAAVQVFGIALTSIYGWQLDLVGDRWTNVTMCVILAVGAVLTFIIKSDLRRQAATKHNNRPDDQ